MLSELINLFRENFPFIVRQDKKVEEILGNENNKVFTRKDEDGKIIGASVVNENTILMLCVDSKFRNKGLGSSLLKESEEHIIKNGHKEINVGVGFEYLMPGVPTSKKVYDEVLKPDNIYSNVDDSAYNFFVKKGYFHSWEECNCFDMRLDLSYFNQNDYSIGDTINGITYVWATVSDISKIVECTDDACEEFTKYYKDEKLYDVNNSQRVLIAKDGDEIVGTLIISIETEAKGLGSVGCTTVKHSHRSRHIGVNLVILGTKFLKDIGLPNAFLGYTYTGLDHMYGYAGYKICIYYFMARKIIS